MSDVTLVTHSERIIIQSHGMSCVSANLISARREKRKAASTYSVGPAVDTSKKREKIFSALEDGDQSQDSEALASKGKAEQLSSLEESDTASLEDSAEDSEHAYREHTRIMIHLHGLEFTKMLFNLEVAKCKKPKVEEKNKK